MGRPAINTALTDPFDTLEPTTIDEAKNAYNSAGNVAVWGTAKDGGFAGWIAGNLAILDLLDGVCGNQLLASPDLDGGAPGNVQTVPPTRYGTLAALVGDDELYVDTTADVIGESCSFLGAELEQVGVIPTGTPSTFFGTDCGGRQPTEDVIDIEYNALAGSGPVGAGLAGGQGLGGLPHGDAGFAISNGVQTKGGAAANLANDDTPPFLGAPN